MRHGNKQPMGFVGYNIELRYWVKDSMTFSASIRRTVQKIQSIQSIKIRGASTNVALSIRKSQNTGGLMKKCRFADINPTSGTLYSLYHQCFTSRLRNHESL